MFSAVPQIDNFCKLITFNMLIAFSVFSASLSYAALYILLYIFVGHFAESTMSVGPESLLY